MMRHSVTVFTVSNIANSLAYYRDRLGFNVAFEYGQPISYVGLKEGNVSLHLISTTRNNRLPGRGAVSIFVDDVDALHADLMRRGARVMSEPGDQTYGIRDFDVTDLDGNMIYFGMPLQRN